MAETHAQTDSNKIEDNDEEMAESESQESDRESENSMEEKIHSKDELMATVNRLKNVSFNLVACFELLNAPLLVIEVKVS